MSSASNVMPPANDVLSTSLNYAERRWRAIQKVINHDLPNQLIAVQGLLQLLSVDESERLSPDGLDVLRRLQGTSSRLLEMIHLLKELAKAQDATDRPVMVSLKELVGQAVAEAKQHSPGLDVTLQIPAGLDKVCAAPSPLQQAMVLLLKLAVQSATGDRVRLVIGGESLSGVAMIWFNFASSRATTPDGQKGPTIWSARAFDERLELLLARELIHGWGELEVGQDPVRGKLFVVRVASK